MLGKRGGLQIPAQTKADQAKLAEHRQRGYVCVCVCVCVCLGRPACVRLCGQLSAFSCALPALQKAHVCTASYTPAPVPHSRAASSMRFWPCLTTLFSKDAKPTRHSCTLASCTASASSQCDLPLLGTPAAGLTRGACHRGFSTRGRSAHMQEQCAAPALASPALHPAPHPAPHPPVTMVSSPGVTRYTSSRPGHPVDTAAAVASLPYQCRMICSAQERAGPQRPSAQRHHTGHI